ncbi:MAG: TIGR02147 family protein [Bdellovibrionaceae bacterium]|nr:TIGR02147 family protein [Pseudobdellovibrionaceae bacterium]
MKNKFEEIKRMNSSFSIRSFAIRSGISSGSMTEILNGRRPLTRNMAEKIATNLNLNPTERSLFFYDRQDQQSLGIKKTRFLSKAQFQYITDASYFSFLSLMDTSNFENDLNWIANKLGITTEKVQTIIYRFKELNIIIENEGKLSKTKDMFSSTDDIKDELVAEAHKETLKAAHRSLSEDALDMRDFTSFCFPVDPSLVSAVKERIRLFQDEIALLMKGQNTTEVFKLAIHLFPETKIEKEIKRTTYVHEKKFKKS